MPSPESMRGTKKYLMKKDEKVVWITGASSGIGAALAKIYAEKGAKLILSSRRVPDLEKVKSECPNSENVKILPIDLNDFDKAAVEVQKAFDFFGTISFPLFLLLSTDNVPFSCTTHTHALILLQRNKAHQRHRYTSHTEDHTSQHCHYSHFISVP